MSGMRISELDFARLLPVFMQDDQAVQALSRAVNDLIGEPGKRLASIRTWDKIDELTEAECDEVAWELAIDWYDSAGMSLKEKRETIKIAQQIKRKRGTKWAVNHLISTYIGEGYVAEWYELGAAPYTFMVLTPETDVQSENFEKFMSAIQYSKNERSHVAGVYFYLDLDTAIEYAPADCVHRYDFEKCGTRNRTATLGVVLKQSIETEPEEQLYKYGFPECGAEGIKATQGAAIVGTAVVGRAIVRA